MIRKLSTICLMVSLCLLTAPCGSAADRQGGQLSWELPGRLSIYDLQFGPAIREEGKWNFLGDMRKFSASGYDGRLTLAIRFRYIGSRQNIPLKFMIKLPNCRQYEEKVILRESQGTFVYRFTVHNPEDFVGAGSVYIYYGFNIVDVLDFTITQET